MGIAYPLISNRRAIRLMDIVATVWLISWVAFGIFVGSEVHDLRELSKTVVASSEVLEQTGNVLGSFEDFPGLGAQLVPLTERIEAAADSARASGLSSRRNIRVLSVAFGVGIALIPTVPLLGLYLPLRIAWKREVDGVRRTLAARQGDPLVREFLARRAAETMSLQDLRELGANPWRELDQGRYGPLSEAALKRLGLEESSSNRVDPVGH